MHTDAMRLPAAMRVIVRDWLSANHVLFLGAGDNAIIDTGYGARAAQTLTLLADPAALGAAPLHRVINTHVHSDHIGGNAALKRRYACSIAVPQAEADLLRAWDTRGLLLDFADQRCERFEFDTLVRPGDELLLGGLAWQAIAAPGHDMGALMFYCPDERILISGDALWQNGFGFVEPQVDSTRCLDAAAATVEAIAGLDVRLVIPGHGRPFADVAGAVERSRSRIEQFRRDPARMVKYALKAFLVFALLDRGGMPLADYPGYLASVPVFGEWNAAFLGEPPDELAAALLTELERAGAVIRRAGVLLPA